MSINWEIARETTRQFELWGEQNHPDGTDPDAWESARDSIQRFVDERAGVGELTWSHLAMEEFYEVLASDPDSPELREELIQLAAVCRSWIGAIDRRKEGV